MKKILSIFIAFVLILNSFTLASADEITIKSTSDIVAESFMETIETDLEIKYSTPLYDGNDEINGYWYHLENGNDRGYMIVFNWRGELKVTEYSFESDLSLDNSKKIYYNGLLSYFYGNDGEVSDTESGREILLNSLYKAPEMNVEETLFSVSNKNTESISPKAYTTKVAHIYGVPKINQNVVPSSERGQMCTQTATAMLIQYYDENKSGYSSIASSSGTSLVLDIRDYMDIGSNGTTLSQFRNGLTSYLDDKGFSVSITTKDAVNGSYTNLSDNDFNLVYNDMVNDKPAIAVIGCNAVTASGTQFPCTIGEDCSMFLHALTVIGTYQNSQSGDMYLEVIDPDGGVDRTLFWDIEITPGSEPSAIWALSRVTIS